MLQGLGASSFTSTVFGVVARADIIAHRAGRTGTSTATGGGAFRSSSAPAQSSIQDLINRTYQMSLNYVNPQSHWTAGIGRLYLPWASSLEVIDGGYVARSVSSDQHRGRISWDRRPIRRHGTTIRNANYPADS